MIGHLKGSILKYILQSVGIQGGSMLRKHESDIFEPE